MLWFKFVLGLNLISFCPKLIIIHYHTQKQKKIKFKPGIKLKTTTAIICSLSKNKITKLLHINLMLVPPGEWKRD